MRAFVLCALVFVTAGASFFAVCSTGIKPNECIVGDQAYAFVKNATTPDACCAACTADPKCGGWTLKTSAQNCALHDGIKARTVNDPAKCKASGLLPGNPTPAPAPGQPTPAPAPSALAFATPFTGGAILQREQRVVVWGSSGESSITLHLADPDISVEAPVESGVWKAYLPAQPAAANRTLTVMDASGNQSVTVSFGEVIICAGRL